MGAMENDGYWMALFWGVDDEIFLKLIGDGFTSL